ncbi:hypothetical protein BCR42DRAFT_415150 [Absidia repens]|uniref:Uncharacterized protein n=1 Tax=Absidia repens TaxID=90262 RepID=A0A1X2IH47_9FUNG|nr:hypothetical protein BCR42DRAFT_415150 [Absidia repens]
MAVNRSLAKVANVWKMCHLHMAVGGVFRMDSGIFWCQGEIEWAGVNSLGSIQGGSGR